MNTDFVPQKKAKGTKTLKNRKLKAEGNFDTSPNLTTSPSPIRLAEC